MPLPKLSDDYRACFHQFMKYFEQEMTALEDPTMNRELQNLETILKQASE